MNLATRFSLATVALVAGTAAAIGVLAYRDIGRAILPAEIADVAERAAASAVVLRQASDQARIEFESIAANTTITTLAAAFAVGDTAAIADWTSRTDNF